MRRNITYSLKTQPWLSMTMGILVAFAVFFSQSFTYTPLVKGSPVQETKTEDQGTDDNHHESSVISQDAVSTFVQVTLTHQLHVITEIYHHIQEVAQVEVDQKISFNSFFKTLFRLIISPNAP